MGIKKDFSQSPIKYNKIRKTDKKAPSRSFARKFQLNTETILDATVTHIVPKDRKSISLVLCIPGGAFISGPAQHHWDLLDGVIEGTEASAWMADYSKAPEVDITRMHEQLDAIYAAAVKQVGSENLILVGDSVGGNLIMTLVQRLIQQGKPVPAKLVLITPVCDASMTHPEIAEIDKVDPMLSVSGVVSAKEMCANGMDLKDPRMSPLLGDFLGFPPTMIFVGGKDIMYPDGMLLIKKMKRAGVEVIVDENAEMPHVYPLLPIMAEGKQARSDIEWFIRRKE